MDKTDETPRTTSTKALRDLLIEVSEEPSEWHNNQEFITALKAQGKLAKWQDDERGIVPCSLNTLKASAEEVLDGGYGRADKLRINALEAIEEYLAKENGPKKGSKAELQRQVDELKRQVSILEQQNTTLVDLVCDLKAKAANYAIKATATTRALCEKDMRGMEAKINLSANDELFKALAEKAQDNE